jgi:hypothetical protein
VLFKTTLGKRGHGRVNCSNPLEQVHFKNPSLHSCKVGTFSSFLSLKIINTAFLSVISPLSVSCLSFAEAEYASLGPDEKTGGLV